MAREFDELLPAMIGAPPGRASLSASALRQAAEEITGAGVSHRQFKLYREAGLLGEPDEDDRWKPAVVGRLVRIHELEKVARPLARRVILVHNEAFVAPPGMPDQPFEI